MKIPLTGSLITTLVRRWESEEAGSGQKVLTETFPDLTAAQVRAVLEGRARIAAGDGGYEYIEEES